MFSVAHALQVSTGPGQAARRGLPVVAHFAVQPVPEEVQRIDAVALQLLRNEPALSLTSIFGPRVSAGLADAPSVLFEDHSEIALFSEETNENLQYRALLLAGEGDIVLIAGRRNSSFEAYCRTHLGLGAAAVVPVEAVRDGRGGALARGCERAPPLLGFMSDTARRYGQLNVVPYLGTGSAWKLAGRISELSGVPVTVAAPPPRLTQRVNDKLWFAGCVKALLGAEALPPSYHAFGPAALTGRVAALARRFERVVIKVPDSAGSQGNIVLDAGALRGMRLRVVRRRLLRLLRNLGWGNRFPLMVSVWDCAVLGSPSVQIWIPRTEAGLPVIEGIFDQVVEGSAGEFVGAVPSDVPKQWQRRLAHDGMMLACLFQRLGYFGRCSFDAVLTGEHYDDAALHWIECNGRWGGTSVPMTLANRLVGDWASRCFMIVQRSGLSIQRCDVPTALDRLGGVLFRSGQTTGGVVLLTPGGLEAGTGLHFLLLGATDTEVKRYANTIEALFGTRAEVGA